MRRHVQTEPPSQPSVAVAIPAYNEANGIAGFLQEIDRALSPRVSRLSLIVIDDASTDDTRDVLEAVRGSLTGSLEVVASPVNRGHGPSVLDGYRRALAAEPDLVLPVDGDGQFHGSDLRRVSHRVRRGGSAQGSTWARAARWPVPWRLVHFSVAALLESREFRRQMDTPGWARDESR